MFLLCHTYSGTSQLKTEKQFKLQFRSKQVYFVLLLCVSLHEKTDFPQNRLCSLSDK